MTGNQISDSSNDRSYFVVTPRLVRLHSRNPFDYTLWSTIKEIAGDKGECYLKTEDLAKMALMSVGQCSNSRDYLRSIRLISGEKKPVIYGTKKSRPTWHLRIPDIWNLNVLVCQKIRTFSQQIAYIQLDKLEILNSPHELRHNSPHESRHNSPGECIKDLIDLLKEDLLKKDDDDEGVPVCEEFFELNINRLTPNIKAKISSLCAEYSEQNLLAAMTITSDYGGETIAYVESVLKNERKGTQRPTKKSGGKNRRSAKKANQPSVLDQYSDIIIS